MLGHRADHFQHLADVPHLPHQLLQVRTAGLDFAGHGFGAVDIFTDLPAALRGQLVGFTGGLRGGDRVARNLLHCRGHFGHGSRGLLQLLPLLTQVVGAFLGDRVQRRGGGVQLPGTVVDLPKGVALALLHALQLMEQLADLVVALPLYRHTQVATGNAPEMPTGFTQGVQHTLGNERPAQHRQHHGHAQQAQAQQLCPGQTPVGLEHDLLATFAQCGHQLLAQGLQPPHGITGIAVDLEILLQRTLAGRFTLPGHRLGVFGKGSLQLGCQRAQGWLAGVFDKFIDQLLALVVQLDRQRHALACTLVMATQLLDKARRHVGAGANRHQQRIVQPVRLVRSLVQFSDLLVATHGSPPGTGSRKQQGQAEQRQHPEHSGANFQVGKHAGSTPCWHHF
ncbi:hypothetical protein D3C80_1111640 [compost metagenome]